MSRKVPSKSTFVGEEDHLGKAQQILGDPNLSSLRLESALAHLQRAIAADASNGECHRTRAAAYLRAGDVKSTITDLRHVLQLEPTDIENKVNLAVLLEYWGKLWLAAGKAQIAISQINEACSLAPIAWPFLMSLAAAYVAAEDYSSALKTLTACIENMQLYRRDIAEHDVLTFGGRQMRLSSLPRVEPWLLRGKILWIMGYIALAVKDFCQCEQIDPEHPEVEGFIGEIRRRGTQLYAEALQYTGKGLHIEALHSLTMAIKILPEDMKIPLTRAAVYRIVLLVSQNLTGLLKTSAFASIPLPYRRLGRLQDALSDIRNASCRYYESMTGLPYEAQEQLHPPYDQTPFVESAVIIRQRSLVLNEIALDLAVQHKYQDALVLLDKIVAEERYRNPRQSMDTQTDPDARFFINRGDCHRGLGHLEEALQDYQVALRQEPEDWEITTRLSLVHYTMGTEYFNDGLTQKGEAYLNKAISLNSKVATYYLQRGKIQFHQGRLELAFQDWRQALVLDPDCTEAMRLLNKVKD